MKRFVCVMFVLFISISISGCQNKREPGPYLLRSQCQKVVNHIIKTYETQNNVYTEGKTRINMIDACLEYPLSATEYSCVMNAESLETIQACLISSVSLP